MNTVYKYKLHFDTEEQFVPLFDGAELLCVQIQDEYYVLWAKVDVSKQPKRRRILCVPTGGDVPDSAKHISTLQDGWYVMHFFDLGEEA